jgi:hypothetical protein
MDVFWKVFAEDRQNVHPRLTATFITQCRSIRKLQGQPWGDKFLEEVRSNAKGEDTSANKLACTLEVAQFLHYMAQDEEQDAPLFAVEGLTVEGDGDIKQEFVKRLLQGDYMKVIQSARHAVSLAPSHSLTTSQEIEHCVDKYLATNPRATQRGLKEDVLGELALAALARARPATAGHFEMKTGPRCSDEGDGPDEDEGDQKNKTEKSAPTYTYEVDVAAGHPPGAGNRDAFVSSRLANVMFATTDGIQMRQRVVDHTGPCKLTITLDLNPGE